MPLRQLLPCLAPAKFNLSLNCNLPDRFSRYRCLVLGLTFLAYTCYHMSRKPISVVKPQLLNCTGDEGSGYANAGHGNVGGNVVLKPRSSNQSVCYSFIREFLFSFREDFA